MKYYSEEEVKRILRDLDHDAGFHIARMTSSTPINPDRERIRMELWKEVFLKAEGYLYPSQDEAEGTAFSALISFDKQFPK